MDLTPDRSRLRYVDAGDLDDATIDFDGLTVRNPQGEKLGDVDGVIVDVSSGRPYYIVVDSGGWFRSKLFLVPIGHVRLDHDNDALVADLTRERIERFPGFDRDEFDKLSDDELDRMDNQIAVACCPDEAANETAPRGDRFAHHRTPDWWNANYVRPDRAGARGVTAGAEYTFEERTASTSRASGGAGAVRSDNAAHDRRDVPESEAVLAREGGDVSPYDGGRAEPGDVIGIETGGERTYLGDTSDNENERRRDAERDAGKQVEEEIDDRAKHRDR